MSEPLTPAGHYVYSTEKFIELKNKLKHDLMKKNINLDNLLQKSIEQSIFRYVKNFNLIN